MRTIVVVFVEKREGKNMENGKMSESKKIKLTIKNPIPKYDHEEWKKEFKKSCDYKKLVKEHNKEAIDFLVDNAPHPAEEFEPLPALKHIKCKVVIDKDKIRS